MRGLSGKVAIVSGGSRGIGKSIALRLVHEGVNVFITAEEMSSELLVSKADCITAAKDKAKAECGVFDLINEGAAEAMVAGAVTAFGRVDILVHNAASFLGGPVEGYSEADLETVLATVSPPTKEPEPEEVEAEEGEEIEGEAVEGEGEAAEGEAGAEGGESEAEASGEENAEG